MSLLSKIRRKIAKARGLRMDPDSGLPIGTIIRNVKGEYGVVGYREIIRVTDEQVAQLKREFPQGWKE